MSKVAIVVQRCHESVVGGSEFLAWQYATLLRERFEVDVLTTTALDIAEWSNTLPEGSSTKDGINIIRFPVTVGRNAYWGQLHQRLVGGFSPFTIGRPFNPDNPFKLRWSIALQEEFILNQGPYSEPLMRFIRERWQDYGVIIFVTYLYPTTYFGMQQLPPGCAIFVPTLHDENTAYLPAYKYSARRAKELFWLTEAEQRVGTKLWGDLPGRVISMSIDVEPREPAAAATRYLLYCGRVDPNKGCGELFDYFIKFKRTFPTRLRLIVTGTKEMEIPSHSDIEFLGFVSAEEKLRLMAGATVYMMPSKNESLSIVTLEAMAQSTPVLANGGSAVLVDHISRSGAGRIYIDYEGFAASLSEMLSADGNAEEMGAAGREYVLSRYQLAAIRKALVEAVESCI